MKDLVELFSSEYRSSNGNDETSRLEKSERVTRRLSLVISNPDEHVLFGTVNYSIEKSMTNREKYLERIRKEKAHIQSELYRSKKKAA